MYIADHVIRSISDPHDRQLVFKDTETGGTEQVQLPAIGPGYVEFDGHLYDCWGREVKFHPDIRKIFRSMGNSLPPWSDYPSIPTFAVEKQNGHFSIAQLTYCRSDVNGHHKLIYEPEKYAPMLGAEVDVMLYCEIDSEFESLDPDFFKGSPIGEAFSHLGVEVWLARPIGGGSAVRFFTSPFYNTHFVICDSATDSGNGEYLHDLCLTSDGRLTGVIRGHCDLHWKTPHYHRICTVELSAESIREYYGKHFDDHKVRKIDLPVRVLTDEVDRYPDLPFTESRRRMAADAAAKAEAEADATKTA